MVQVIGIDGGGTSCKAAIADLDGRVHGTGMAGPANIMTDIQQARDNIIEAAHRACLAASIAPAALSRTTAVLGLAGAGVGDRAEVIAAMLPFACSVVENDALTSLEGALGQEEGVVAVIGTGSVFAARTGGVIRTIGGWGFMLGDVGGGARLGRALLQEVLLVHDGLRRPSPLTEEVFSLFGDDPFAVVEFAHEAQPNAFASFAPAIFKHADHGDDPVGIALVQGALHRIEETLAAIVPPDCDRLCMLGGLGPFYARRLSGRFQALLREPLGDAVDGAIRLAIQHHGKQTGPAMTSHGGRG
jgi:glucosamine kinase